MSLDALKPCIATGIRCSRFPTYRSAGHTYWYDSEKSLLSIVADSPEDLQLKNLLLPGDPKNFSGLEDSEIEEPSPRKVLGPERTIYTSHIVVPGNGLPLLSDFGEARFSEEEHDEDIMRNLYRAPEVVLKMKWDNKVDVWSSALMVRDGAYRVHSSFIPYLPSCRPGIWSALKRYSMAETVMMFLMIESILLRWLQLWDHLPPSSSNEAR